MPTPLDQSRYQLRLDWGLPGLARLAPADVVVVVDVLRVSSAVAARLAAGEEVLAAASAHAVSRDGLDGATVAVEAAAAGALVLLGSLRTASAVARAVLAEQNQRRARTFVNVIACGERMPGAAGIEAAPRVAVEDLLGAGAVIDALGALGIDHTSPEAAVACEAFRGLRGAVRHLLTASGSGQELIDRGLRDEVLAAASIDDLDVAPRLRGGVFTPS